LNPSFPYLETAITREWKETQDLKQLKGAKNRNTSRQNEALRRSPRQNQHYETGKEGTRRRLDVLDVRRTSGRSIRSEGKSTVALAQLLFQKEEKESELFGFRRQSGK